MYLLLILCIYIYVEHLSYIFLLCLPCTWQLQTYQLPFFKKSMQQPATTPRSLELIESGLAGKRLLMFKCMHLRHPQSYGPRFELLKEFLLADEMSLGLNSIHVTGDDWYRLANS